MPRRATAKQAEAVTALATVARQVVLQQVVEVLDRRIAQARGFLADSRGMALYEERGCIQELTYLRRHFRRLLRRGKR